MGYNDIIVRQRMFWLNNNKNIIVSNCRKSNRLGVYKGIWRCCCFLK